MGGTTYQQPTPLQPVHESKAQIVDAVYPLTLYHILLLVLSEWKGRSYIHPLFSYIVVSGALCLVLYDKRRKAGIPDTRPPFTDVRFRLLVSFVSTLPVMIALTAPLVRVFVPWYMELYNYYNDDGCMALRYMLPVGLAPMWFFLVQPAVWVSIYGGLMTNAFLFNRRATELCQWGVALLAIPALFVLLFTTGSFLVLLVTC